MRALISVRTVQKLSTEVCARIPDEHPRHPLDSLRSLPCPTTPGFDTPVVPRGGGQIHTVHTETDGQGTSTIQTSPMF
jgi:hypothetical protein